MEEQIRLFRVLTRLFLESKQNHFTWKYRSNSPKLTLQAKDFPAIVNGFRHRGFENGLFTKILFKGLPFQFQLDSGASVNIIPVSFVYVYSISCSTTNLRMWNGTETDVLGEATLEVHNSKTSHTEAINFLVTEKKLQPIFGLDATQ